MDTETVTRGTQLVTAAMIHSLRYPFQKVLCLRAITTAICALYLGQGRNRRMNKLLRSGQHDFFNTITAFVTTQRSEADSRVLIERLFWCNCNRIDPTVDVFHEGLPELDGLDAEGLFLAMENKMFMTLTSILVHLPKDRLDKSYSGTSTDCWPTKLSQLMPNGESATVESFIAHAMKGKSTHSLSTLSGYYQSIPSTLEYAIGRGNCFSAIPFNLDIAVDYFKNASADDFSGPVYTEHIQRIIALYNYLTGIDYVFSGSQLDRAQLDRLKHILETNALSSYEKVARLIHIFSSLSLHSLEPEATSALHNLANMLMLHIPESTIKASKLKLHPVSPDSKTYAESFPNSRDPYMRLYCIIEYYLKRKDCSSPDCAANQKDEKRAFSYCSGCRCMKFCSKECQKTCWTLSYAPHKKICKTLSSLRQMVVDAEKKGIKINRADSFLRMKIFKDNATDKGTSPEEAMAIYEEMRNVYQKDEKKTRAQNSELGFV